MDKGQQHSTHFYFKWMQNVSDIDYFSLREDGSQLVAHIPNIMQIIANKSSLLESFTMFGRRELWERYFPETYYLDMLGDQVAFVNSKTEGTWILKPRNLNQGRGIAVVDDVLQFKREFQHFKR